MAKTQKQVCALLSAPAQSFVDTAVPTITDAVDMGTTARAVLCVELLALSKSKTFAADAAALFGTGTGKGTVKGVMHERLGDYASEGAGRNLLSCCRGICEGLQGAYADVVRAALKRGAFDPAYKARLGPKLGSKGPKAKGDNPKGAPKADSAAKVVTFAELMAREVAADPANVARLFASALRIVAQTVRATEVDAVAEKLAA